MRPYYECSGVTLFLGDAREVLPTLTAGSVNLLATDPPYCGVKDEAWDRQWASEEAYLDWLEGFFPEWRRVLAANGSLYCFADPSLAARVEVRLRPVFRVLNHLRWVKPQGWHKRTELAALRSFLSPSEDILFAEQYATRYDEAMLAHARYEDATRQLHKAVYAPLGRYIQQERERAGLTRNEVMVALGYTVEGDGARGTGLCWMWEHGNSMPTAETYERLRQHLRAVTGDTTYLRREYEDLRREYEDLRREYEDLRREYEDLRRPFIVRDARYAGDVWHFDTVDPMPGKHPCEKPLALMRHIILTSSRVGDTVLDCFAGSGTTLLAARDLGRRAIGVESDERYAEMAARRLSQMSLPLFTEDEPVVAELAGRGR